jgi:aquaporin Z
MKPLLTFFRLGKVEPWDALFYGIAQFAGGIAGACLAAACLGPVIAHPSVNYVATTPGMAGAGIAFVAEFVIAFGIMSPVASTRHVGRKCG